MVLGLQVYSYPRGWSKANLLGRFNRAILRLAVLLAKSIMGKCGF